MKWLFALIFLALCSRPVFSQERVVATGGGYVSCVFKSENQIVFSRLDLKAAKEILYLKDLDSGREEKLFAGSQPIFFGDLLVYVSQEPGAEGIYLYNFSTKKSDAFFKGPTLSSVSLNKQTQKGYQSVFRDGQLGIEMIDLQTKSSKMITESGETNPVVSPDGNMLLFVRDNQIWQKMLGNGAEKVLTTAPENWSPSFSPDGKCFIYIEQTIQPLANVALFDFDTGRKRMLTDKNSEARSPCFAPSGRYFAYIGLGGSNLPNAIWVVKKQD